MSQPSKEAPAVKADSKGGKTALSKGDSKEVSETSDRPKSRLAWLVGWVLVPSTLIGLVFGGGALVGAHFHTSWFTRLIVWVVALFV
ncbi:MAG: hypothetical protein JKY37_09885 [Nannocystaceae bacterium]|nr:hypothetical protein [Nannocystaceae bacterium]